MNFDSLTYYWMLFGGFLMILELILPAFFLLWIGIAAFLTGLISFGLNGISLIQEAVIFSILSLIFIIIGLKTYKSQHSGELSATPKLNNKAESLIGMQITLDEDLPLGRGKIKIHDAYWSVESKIPLQKGMVAVVNDIKGSVLHIHKI